MNPDINTFQKLELVKPVKVDISLQQLETVRLQNDFHLPNSYCNFVLNFGFGVLCDFFYIFIPDDSKENLIDRSHDLKTLIIETLEAEMIEEFYDKTTPDLVKKLVPFGISKNGDTLAWSPEESVYENEYVIYVLSPEMTGVRRAADSLYDFIDGCLQERIKEMMGIGFSPLPPTFEPI